MTDSRIVIVNNLVFCTVEPTPNAEPAEGLFEPTGAVRSAFDELEQHLRSVGASLDNVVFIRAFVRSLRLEDQIRDELSTRRIRPAGTTILVTNISSGPQDQVALEVTAALSA